MGAPPAGGRGRDHCDESSAAEGRTAAAEDPPVGGPPTRGRTEKRFFYGVVNDARGKWLIVGWASPRPPSSCAGPNGFLYYVYVLLLLGTYVPVSERDPPPVVPPAVRSRKNAHTPAAAGVYGMMLDPAAGTAPPLVSREHTGRAPATPREGGGWHSFIRKREAGTCRTWQPTENQASTWKQQ